MPKCGSQITLCNFPIRFDTYKGCSHNCKYCFTYRKYDISTIKEDETAKSLINFINGKRTRSTNWCDWNIPIHWGGMSDPFQPAELKYKNSLECLKVFAQTKYPFIVSTKNVLPTQEPYYSLFKECNCVFQCSMVCPTLSKLEEGAPHFNERLEMMRKISKIVPRTIVRCQPYLIELHKEIKEQIPKIAEAGVYGITFEALKMQKKSKGLERNGGDFVYPLKLLKPLFTELKEVCHKYGLKFYCGENRLRGLGDSLSCCGCDNMEGFTPNLYNLNQKIYNPAECVCTNKMQNGDTGGVFNELVQATALKIKKDKNVSFKQMMDIVFSDKNKVQEFTGIIND